ncbi:Phosphopantothenoylcysteine decarboxylase / Phosphopantothenoylcysteine synthetase [hydrothermal vent metagenome]|uniref:Phosphopantothenoylcysteine decarboxylase / Phosphopantothenoylcysteine synthetase n=1 Tax=hydrothermal vent metagenome TaxID=652676 RepID=A0A3B0YCU6_9ZZZZ
MTKSLNNKNILLGVCGGIAAYKSADLVRRLKDAGADVRVLMTAAATEFITPLTFQALSGYPVHTDLLDTQAEAGMGHIELARWADLILIAPATANSIARLVNGQADDLLCAVCLASRSKMAIAPAMNHVMWTSQATQKNIQQLLNRQVSVFGPASGSQACGEVGTGRLLESGEIVNACAQLFRTGLLQGVNVTISAGPTFEPIDPVRYIGNRSSGRMGFAIAEAAAEQGAMVTLVAGPVHLQTPENVKRVDVETAAQMHQAVMQDISQQSIFIATAAVSDFRPEQTQTQKIKKNPNEPANHLNIPLIQNPDILADVAALDNAPFTLGFAAETQDVKHYALGKLKKKKLNMIAANQVAHDSNSGQDQLQEDTQDTGFNSEYNTLQVFWPVPGADEDEGAVNEITLERTRKSELARKLISLLAEQYQAQSAL